MRRIAITITTGIETGRGVEVGHVHQDTEGTCTYLCIGTLVSYLCMHSNVADAVAVGHERGTDIEGEAALVHQDDMTHTGTPITGGVDLVATPPH